MQISATQATGQCRCGQANAYSDLVCSTCGARLPWADALTAASRQPPPAPPPPTHQPIAPIIRGGVPPTSVVVMPMLHDETSIALNILCFMYPIVGIGAYLLLVPTMPRQAISAGRSSLYGLLAWFLGFFLMYLLAAVGIYSAFHPAILPTPTPSP